MPLQPQKLDDINILNSFCSTLSGENFLVKDSIIEEKRILLFTTKANIQHLSNFLYWIMDSTFKTAPTIFRQLYTIHALVGTGDNSRVLPLIYALITKKSEFLYRALFQDLIEFAEENNILLSPTAIFIDFELVAINASHIEFPNDFSIKLHQLFALAFLLSNKIPAAFDILKEEMPTKTKEPFTTSFSTTNVEFQKEQQKVEHQVEAIIRGAQHQTPKKGTIEREQRFDIIINN
ncbi:10485_t:CDS:2 [Dentiscutata heterogama]|uniref:10485_t:CDS:1 n=1 Tax=Dentiscutata heterogama TaxID=1316150 RepID=A0ACA9JVU0_9GLOM|nr:10485_t:CDS:2 [Dentiscutata heterogama]